MACSEQIMIYACGGRFSIDAYIFLKMLRKDVFFVRVHLACLLGQLGPKQNMAPACSSSASSSYLLISSSSFINKIVPTTYSNESIQYQPHCLTL